jgi:hypothetical protein
LLKSLRQAWILICAFAALTANAAEDALLQQKTGGELLQAVKRFLESESLFDVAAVEKHFGLKLSANNAGDPDKWGHKTFTISPKQSLEAVLYFHYAQYRTTSLDSGAAITIQVRNRKALCVREADVFSTFGAKPLAKVIPPPIRHFRTREARERFEAESVRAIDESVAYTQVGRYAARVTINFEVY